MFIILLHFSENKNQAKDHMDGHNQWLQQGFSDEVFMLAGGVKPRMGGVILAHNASFDEIQERVNADPFVTANVVSSEIIEVSPSKAQEKLQFLLDE